MTRRAAFTIFAVFFVVATFHLLTFGFRQSDDGPYWIKVAELFRSGLSGSAVSAHYIFYPAVPLIALAISLFGFSYLNSYLIINLVSLLATSFFLYKISNFLFKDSFISTTSSVLFLIDFNTQSLAFAVMPDALTWTFIVILIYLSIKLAVRHSSIRGSDIGIWSLVLSLGILVKSSFIFFIPVFPFILLRDRGENKLLKLTLSVLLPILPVIIYYSWVLKNFGHLPWETFVTDKGGLNFSNFDKVTSMMSAFLYLWPAILIGLWQWLKLKKKQINRLLIIVVLFATFTPVILWPYVMARFYFTMFWFILPLAAFGLTRLLKKRWAVAVVIVGVYLLSLMRVNMTNQRFFSHLDFFSYQLHNFLRS